MDFIRKGRDAIDNSYLITQLIVRFGVFSPTVQEAGAKPETCLGPPGAAVAMAGALANLGEPALAPMVSRLLLQDLSDQDADTIRAYLLRDPDRPPPYPQRWPQRTSLEMFEELLLKARDPELLSAYLHREKESKMRTKDWYKQLQEPIPTRTGESATVSEANHQQIRTAFDTLYTFIKETGGDEETIAALAELFHRVGGTCGGVKELCESLALYDGDVLPLMAEALPPNEYLVDATKQLYRLTGRSLPPIKSVWRQAAQHHAVTVTAAGGRGSTPDQAEQLHGK
ncbi:MAG: hypothetical protein KAI66_25425 [Lentisphaeria bacterium]|nr:hypothetical protein [Lentisphaeria bacterium]